MGNEWFDKEICQISLNMFNLENQVSAIPILETKGEATFCNFPARSSIHFLLSSQPLLRHNRPLFPRRLINISGFATSFLPSLTQECTVSARSRTSLTWAR